MCRNTPLLVRAADLLEAAARRWEETAQLADEADDSEAYGRALARADTLLADAQALCLDAGRVHEAEALMLQRAQLALDMEDADSVSRLLLQALEGALAREDVERVAAYLEEAPELFVSRRLEKRVLEVRRAATRLAVRLGEAWWFPETDPDDVEAHGVVVLDG
jgi:hypothetical protein